MIFFGLVNHDKLGNTITLATSMESLIKPYSYSLSFSKPNKRNPKTAKALCNALNTNGSYWSGGHEPLTAAMCHKIYNQLTEENKIKLQARVICLI